MSSDETNIGQASCYKCNKDAMQIWTCPSEECGTLSQRSKFFLCEDCTFACPFCGTIAQQQDMQLESDASNRRDSSSTTNFSDLKDLVAEQQEEMREIWKAIGRLNETQKKTGEEQQKLSAFLIRHAIGGKLGDGAQPLTNDQKYKAIIIGILWENMPGEVELQTLVKACDTEKRNVNRVLHQLADSAVAKRTNPGQGKPKWTLDAQSLRMGVVA